MKLRIPRRRGANLGCCLLLLCDVLILSFFGKMPARFPHSIPQPSTSVAEVAVAEQQGLKHPETWGPTSTYSVYFAKVYRPKMTNV